MSATHNEVIRFRLEAVTKGAGKYNEVSEDGRILNPFSTEATIGTLYVRKSALGRMGFVDTCPRSLTVTINVTPA